MAGQAGAGAMLPEVVFLGAGAFGVPTLEALARAGRVALVVSQPDREAGRGKRPTPTPISEFALAHGLPLLRNVPTDQVRVHIASEQRSLEKQHRRRPNRWTASKPGQDELAHHRLHLKEQEGAGEDGDRKEQSDRPVDGGGG
jgi:hypothetical protein